MSQFQRSFSTLCAIEYRDNLIGALAQINGFAIGDYGQIIRVPIPKEYRNRSKKSRELEKMLIAEILHFSRLIDNEQAVAYSEKSALIPDNKMRIEHHSKDSSYE